jgi:hypothetical protein
MPIPSLDRHGLLPTGVHDCLLTEVEERFCWNGHRVGLLTRFKDFLGTELRAKFPDPILLDGSFVTDKENPDDTDVLLDLGGAPAARQLEALLFMNNHQNRIGGQYRVHFWVNIPGAANDFTAFFQYIGVKTAMAKGLDPKHHKGILRLL